MQHRLSDPFGIRRLIAALRPPPPTPFDRAVRLLETGKRTEAIAAFTALIHAAQTDAERAAALNKRGVARVTGNERDAALADFAEALACVPQFAPAIVNVGNLLYEDGDVDEAIVHYEAAIRSDDAYAVAHLNLGVALKAAGRRGEAVRHLRAANRLEGRVIPRRRLNTF